MGLYKVMKGRNMITALVGAESSGKKYKSH